ncbi:Transcription repressor OFP2 [Carex littledalei]|uniref:Transcription repressor n=1 Tax=Carex littledalei TaxID=544730 RepID=A0A833QSB0_9POAL|nr:Transcription repressor OFP2 [Carex littledalei]
MRWGRKRTQDQEENSTEKKSFSLSELLSFSWLSKPRSNNKTQTNTSPKSPSCKSKCVSNNPIPSTKLHEPTTDQTVFAPRRRSVGDQEDRALRNNHRRHYSVGGDHVSAASSITLGHVIPFSVTPKQERNSPVLVSPLYREIPHPGLHSHKARRRRKLKSRLVIHIAASDDSRRRKSKIRSARYRYHQVGCRSLDFRQGREGLEDFAVVKRSREPERDFKKSMVEMIVEKEMRQPEELESLLACYLTLNADEHHDVIVKVFRQVCSQINRKQFN